MDKLAPTPRHRSWTRLRSLGALEQAFWLCDRHHPAHFALAAEIEGMTTPAGWRAAFDALQQRHPMLNVGIAAGDGGAPFFVRAEAAPVPLRLVPGPADWQAEMAWEMSRRFAPGKAPLIRATLLPGESAATCILTAHHSIADGVSLTYLFRDLLRSLAGRRLAPLPMPPSHEERLGLPTDVSPAPAADVPPAPQAGYRTWDGTPPRVDGLRLSTTLSDRLRTRARREHTTVHGALAAALVLAHRQTLPAAPKAPVSVLSPIDTRGVLGLDDECALVVEAAVSRVAHGSGDPVWELARQVTGGLATARTLPGIQAARAPLCQAAAAGLNVPTAARLFAQVYGHDLLLSNLGPLRFGPDFGALRLTAVWGPAVLFGLEGAQTVGVTTVGGAIHLLHTSFQPVPALLATAGGFLADACGGPRQP